MASALAGPIPGRRSRSSGAAVFRSMISPSSRLSGRPPSSLRLPSGWRGTLPSGRAAVMVYGSGLLCPARNQPPVNRTKPAVSSRAHFSYRGRSAIFFSLLTLAERWGVCYNKVYILLERPSRRFQFIFLLYHIHAIHSMINIFRFIARFIVRLYFLFYCTFNVSLFIHSIYLS